MPPLLGRWFPAAWSGAVPHLSKGDQLLWTKVRGQLVQDAVALYFDVGLGKGAPVPPGTDPALAAMWLKNTQKRADVVIERPHGWEIVELRESAKSSAVGRLLMYLKLWAEDPPDARPVSATLVTNVADDDVRSLCETLGIRYLVV